MRKYKQSILLILISVVIFMFFFPLMASKVDFKSIRDHILVNDQYVQTVIPPEPEVVEEEEVIEEELRANVNAAQDVMDNAYVNIPLFQQDIAKGSLNVLNVTNSSMVAMDVLSNGVAYQLEQAGYNEIAQTDIGKVKAGVIKDTMESLPDNLALPYAAFALGIFVAFICTMCLLFVILTKGKASTIMKFSVIGFGGMVLSLISFFIFKSNMFAGEFVLNSIGVTIPKEFIQLDLGLGFWVVFGAFVVIAGLNLMKSFRSDSAYDGAIRQSTGERVFDGMNVLFLAVCSFTMVFPLWNVLMISLIDKGQYYAQSLVLWPNPVNFTSYLYILYDQTIPKAFLVTVALTLVGTAYSMIITTAFAYAMSKKYLPGRGIVSGMLTFTMFFGGGMIASFLLMKSLGFMNNPLVYFIPNGVGVWNYMVIKSFFTQLSPELEESAKIDGANDITIFIKIILPISTPVLATFALFFGVGYWNSWFLTKLYMQGNKDFYTLQFVLRELMKSDPGSGGMATTAWEKGLDLSRFFDEGVKITTVVIATVPIMCVYPFLQKYFTKGIMLGAVKG